MALSSQNLKALFSNPDKKLMQFIMNVAANTPSFGVYTKTLHKLANKKININYKKKIIRRKAHLFLKRLLVKNISAYKQL